MPTLLPTCMECHKQVPALVRNGRCKACNKMSTTREGRIKRERKAARLVTAQEQ